MIINEEDILFAIGEEVLDQRNQLWSMNSLASNGARGEVDLDGHERHSTAVESH